MDRLARVMVTGSRGLLGATLIRTLPGAIACTADIRDSGAVMEQALAVRPQWVVHTAAKTDVAACERDPAAAHAVNVDGTRHVIAAARAAGARAIYVSTASVFKGDKGDYREDDAPEPVNAYNRSKREGELRALEHAGTIVLRLNLVGIHPDGSRGRNFLEWLVDSVSANKNLNLFDDAFINPLSNWTIAAMIGSIIGADLRVRLLHIGTSDVLSKADIGRMVVEKFPAYAGALRFTSVDSIADGVARPKQMWLNTERAAGLLGPMPSFAQELATIFANTTVGMTEHIQ